VSTFVVFRAIAIVVFVFAFVLMLWNILAPLKYIRVFTSSSVSVASCSSFENYTAYIVVIYTLQFLLLLAGCYMSYKSAGMNAILNESKYVSMAMVSLLQVKLALTPLEYLLTDQPGLSKFYIVKLIMTDLC